MKGFSLAIAGILVTFFVVMAVLIPVFATKIHVQREMIYQTKYSSVQLALVSLLSSTEVDTSDGKTKPVYDILAEYVAFSTKPSIAFLGQKLDSLVDTKRYSLFYVDGGQTVVLKSSSLPPSQFTTTTKLLLPYDPNRMYVDLTLVMD